ncbi:MAG: hypothetical protein HKN47_26360 [Pirellulaceae bacterium]|nr:hypothetical protein [Pirellulaceae bacterium]
MHERTERAIARLLFVFCCAVPTGFVVLMILVSWTPWVHHRQLRALESQLSRDTGLVVQIEDFDRVSPTKWSLQNLVLIEPETLLEVARVRKVTWLQEDDRIGISLHQTEIQSPQIEHAWQLVHDRYLCRPELTQVPMQLSAIDVTIHSDTGSLPLPSVDAWIKPRPNSVQATIHCVQAGRSQSPIKVSVIRDRGSEIPRTQWTLETGPTALPCSALAGYFPLLERLGPDAEFLGTLQWELQRDGAWSIDLGGSRFTQIELSRLFEDLPHRFTGTADLALERCWVVPNEAVNISGSLRAHNGWMGRSLLRSLQEELDFAVDVDSIQARAGDIPYDLVSLHFDMTDWQLRLHGTCSGQRGYELLQPGIVICGHDRPLARSSENAIASIQLAHAIAPDHSELVPISRQTAGMLDLFVPPSHATPINPQAQPSPRIKRAAHWSGGELIRQ